MNADNYQLDSVKIQLHSSDSWLDPSSATFTTQSNNTGRLYIGGQAIKYWRAKFTPLAPAGSMTVMPYMELNANIYYTMNTTQNYSGQTITGALYLTTPEGTVYEFPVVDQIDVTNDSGALVGYHVKIGGTVEVGTGFDTGDCTVEFILSGITNASCVDVSFTQLTFNATETITENTVKIVESIEQGFADLSKQQAEDAEKTHGFLGTIIEYIKNLPSNLWSFFKDSLDGILSWLTSIKTGVDNVITGIAGLPGKIFSAFDEVLSGIKFLIIDLPVRIRDEITQLLIDLFIPDQDFLNDYIEQYVSYFEENFTVLYECTTIISDCFKSINSHQVTSVIVLPEITIPLLAGESFTFGGYHVAVIPEGFEVFADIVRTVFYVVMGVCCLMTIIRFIKRIVGDFI